MPRKRTSKKLISAFKHPAVAISTIAPLAAVAISIIALLVTRPDPTISVATIAAVSALLGSVVTVTLGRYFDRERERELELREQQVPEYEKFISFWSDLLVANKTGDKPPTAQQLTKELSNWSKKISIWGSDEVIRKWGDFRAASTNVTDQRTSTPIDVLTAFAEIILALRKEVGYPATNLEAKDVLRLWITDIDKYLTE